MPHIILFALQNARDLGHMWGLLEQVKSRGVNREKCDEISSQIVNAAVELNAVHVKVWLTPFS